MEKDIYHGLCNKKIPWDTEIPQRIKKKFEKRVNNITNLLIEKPTIFVIIFWNLTMFQYRSNSPQVKWNTLSTIANLVKELSHEFPNNLGLRILGNNNILRKS